MKPVAVIQHDAAHRPGLLLASLQSNGVGARTFLVEETDPSTVDIAAYSGLVVLGRAEGASEPAPWLAGELRLVDEALKRDVPVLGHSFGGRLLARVMGAEVRPASEPNIGWEALHVTPCGLALFDDAHKVMAFNWHRETFSIPDGATRTLFSKYTLNEGYAYGRHLAFQCHLEVTPEAIRQWCKAGRSDLRHADGCIVQREAEILARMPLCLPMLQRAAKSLYGHWIAGLKTHAAQS